MKPGAQLTLFTMCEPESFTLNGAPWVSETWTFENVCPNESLSVYTPTGL